MTNCLSQCPKIISDIYCNTKEVLKAVKSDNKERLSQNLPSQGATITFLLTHSLEKLNGIWSITQSNLPSNIFTFTIKYLNNTLPTRKNLLKWNLGQTSDCEFCLLPETLLHVIAGCKVYLDLGHYTLPHNSALNFLATSFQAINRSSLYADLPGFLSPSIITGDQLRPDFLLKNKENCLFVLELSMGFETNLNCSVNRKSEKYATLISDLKRQSKSVSFVNLSLSSLCIFDNSCSSFIDICDSLSIDHQQKRYLISKLSSISIRTTYYIFYCRNKTQSNPGLLPF